MAITYNELWRVASTQMRWIVDIDIALWKEFGRACDLSGPALRHLCIESAHISYHFFWRRVLLPASELPWKLCRGDPEEMLDWLHEQECPCEPLSAQIWQLLHQGFSRVQLSGVLRLLGQAGWTSLPCEQQHGSIAQCHR